MLRTNLKYEPKEMVYDCVRDGKNVIVFDVNTKLINNKIYNRIKVEFPEVHRMLLILNIKGALKLGSAVIIQARGFVFAALVTQHKLYGPDKDENDTIVQTTIKCVDDLYKKLDVNNRVLISGILNRDNNLWKPVAKYITSKNIKWNIYVE